MVENNNNKKDNNEDMEDFIRNIQVAVSLKSIFKHIDDIDVDSFCHYVSSVIDFGVKEGMYNNELDTLKRILASMPYLVKAKNIFFGKDNRSDFRSN